MRIKSRRTLPSPQLLFPVISCHCYKKGRNVKIKRKTQAFFGAFAITVILIGALCGFVAVDLSTDRYMPDRFGPFFEIAAITPGGVEFSFLAGDYILDAAPARAALAELAKYRGLFPQAPRAFSAITAESARRLLSFLAEREQSEP